MNRLNHENRTLNLNNVVKAMKNRYTIAVLLLVVVAGTFAVVSSVTGQETSPASAQATSAPQAGAWSVRCNGLKEGEPAPDDRRGKCEIFQRLVMAETGQRVAEFAIGFPENADSARGVVIMPLGILLDTGIQMTVDEGEPFKARVRYCNQGGCYAYLSLNDEVISLLRKGSQAGFMFMDSSGKKIRVNMSLGGLTRAMREIQ